MFVDQRLGGRDHKFTGKEKVQPFIMADPKEKRQLYPTQRCGQVEYYPFTKEYILEVENYKSVTYSRPSYIWLPIDYLEQSELQELVRRFKSKAAQELLDKVKVKQVA